MRSIVISALFDALPDAGYSCLRFNFRGVEGSAGAHGDGATEPDDVRAALDDAIDLTVDGGITAIVGWSFGADMALSVADPRVSGWVGDRAAAAVRRTRSTRSRSDAAPEAPGARAARRVPRSRGRATRGRRRWTNVTTEVVAGRESLLRRPHRPRGRGDRGIPRVADARMNR